MADRPMRMLRVLRALAVSAGVVMAACTSPPPGAPAPRGSVDLPAPAYSLDDWLSVNSVGSFLWSPDGARFYFTRRGNSGTSEIFRVSADGGEPVQLSESASGIRPEPKNNLVLSADGRTFFFTSSRLFETYDNIWRMPVSGGPAEIITFNDAVIETGPAPSPDGRTLAYFARTRQGARIFLRELGTDRVWSRMFSDGAAQEVYPTWSPDGRWIAFSRGGDIWLRPSSGGDARRVVEGAYTGGNGSAVWSPDGSKMAFTRSETGYSQVGVVDVATGRVTPITFSENQHADVSWSPDGRTLVFVRNDDGGMSRDVVVAPADGSGRMTFLTQGRGQGMRYSPQYSPDGRWIAFVETTGTRTRDIWKVPAGGGRAVQVTNSMGVIDPAVLSAPEEARVVAPDNLGIPTLLYRPREFDPNGRYPVIMAIHGHPGQFNHSFNMRWQYFLDRGFVIVAPNPRGSRDFGQGFHDLHIGDYGGAELQDLMSVIPFLEDLGYVDMNRKATWGGSGGGYLSFALATDEPDAFEAQIIDFPVSDWRLMANDRFAASGRAWTATRTPVRERSEFGGTYQEIPEEYDRRSPINFVENVTVPQLLNIGLRDSRTPVRQARIWYERMVELGKGDLIEYVEYADEDHGLSRYAPTIRDRIERAERFLARHLDLPGLVR